VESDSDHAVYAYAYVEGNPISNTDFLGEPMARISDQAVERLKTEDQVFTAPCSNLWTKSRNALTKTGARRRGAQTIPPLTTHPAVPAKGSDMRIIAAAICLIVTAFMYSDSACASTHQFVHLTGHYSDEDLVKGAAPKLLPMTFLYDANNSLVPADQWPEDLAEVKKHIGNGYCCVSENKPEKEGEPPADCVRAVFGTDIKANFKGLKDSAGNAIRIRDVPKHQWLLVVYAAAWCAPCLKEAMALNEFFKTSEHASDYVWITLDVTRMIEAKAAAKAAKSQ
jgi:AhpC/TSA family